MAQMHGKYLFIGLENVRGLFLVDVASVYETEHPYRSCNHAWFIHVWPGKAVVVGLWRKKYGEMENLFRAVKGGRDLDVQEKDTLRVLGSPLPESASKTEADEFS